MTLSSSRTTQLRRLSPCVILTLALDEHRCASCLARSPTSLAGDERRSEGRAHGLHDLSVDSTELCACARLLLASLVASYAQFSTGITLQVREGA